MPALISSCTHTPDGKGGRQAGSMSWLSVLAGGTHQSLCGSSMPVALRTDCYSVLQAATGHASTGG